MHDLIIEKLSEIEQREHVKVIYAAESGSRAWGFASPDSDYDVRFIYVRRMQDYLLIDHPRDVIEWQLDETLDINGWDIQKALRLLRKSNPTLFEWSNSPVVYRTTPEWERILPVINHYFSSKAGMHHYLSMAAGNYREYLKGELVRIKKYLYVLRPLLACRWILAHGSPPPMLFDELVAAELDGTLKPAVADLLELKKHSPELELMPRVDTLNHYIGENLAFLTEQVNCLPEEAPVSSNELNAIFLSLLKEERHI